jgi:hypothetical protein
MLTRTASSGYMPILRNAPELMYQTASCSPSSYRATVPSIDQACQDYLACAERMRRAVREGDARLASMLSMEHKKSLYPNLRAKCVALVESRLRMAGKADWIGSLSSSVADDAIECFSNRYTPCDREAPPRGSIQPSRASVSARESLIRCVDEAVSKLCQRPAV